MLSRTTLIAYTQYDTSLTATVGTDTIEAVPTTPTTTAVMLLKVGGCGGDDTALGSSVVLLVRYAAHL